MTRVTKEGECTTTPKVPGLSPQQLERLALLAEEMGEAQQAIGKILRHGYDSHNPYAPEKGTNTDMLERELGDVAFAVELLCYAGDLSEDDIHRATERKKEAVRPYLHHQPRSYLK